MPKKEALIAKLMRKPSPSNFTVRELDALLVNADVKRIQAEEDPGLDIYIPKQGGY